jgi:hypothetical protein
MGKNIVLSKNGILKIGVFPQTKANGGDFELFKPGLYVDSDGRQAVKNGDSFYLMEPILWEIIKMEGNRSLLLSVKKLKFLCFSSKNDSDYEKSPIRTFLNGPFFKKAFSAKEKSIISKTGPFGDCVFLPSKEELMDPYDLIFDKKETDYASGSCKWLCGDFHSWLTRTPGEPDWLGCMDDLKRYETVDMVAQSYSGGDFRWRTNTLNSPAGIAPAMWIEIPDGYDVSPIVVKQVE